MNCNCDSKNFCDLCGDDLIISDLEAFAYLVEPLKTVTVGQSEDKKALEEFLKQVSEHFHKMFVGFNSILLNDENTQMLGVVSKEGEKLLFKTPVSIEAIPKINDWLTLVEREIQNLLA